MYGFIFYVDAVIVFQALMPRFRALIMAVKKLPFGLRCDSVLALVS